LIRSGNFKKLPNFQEIGNLTSKPMSNDWNTSKTMKTF